MSRLSASGPHRSSLCRRLRPRENAATRLRGARAAALALLALAALSLAAAENAAAQSVTTLVSNVGQGQDDNWSGTADRSQAFTTGAAGATLSSVEIISEDPAGDDVAVSLCTVDGSSHPTSDCTALTAPSSFAAGTLVFTDPASTTLAANTTYSLLVTSPGRESVSLDVTRSDSEDSVSNLGWSIANAFDQKNASNVWVANSTRSLRITIKGTSSSNNSPTAADNTVTTGAGTAYTFTADDFGFADTDAGATLASVKIVTVPAAGILALDGTAAITDQVVTKAQIDDGNLTFTPVAGASGDPYTTFTFKVNDGTDDSASAYTMTIDVTAAPVVLAGQVFVDNTGEATHGTDIRTDNGSSQSFTTGPNTGGYILTSIGVVAVLVNSGDAFSLAVHTADTNGAPGALHASMIPPGNFPAGTNAITFTAPPNTMLDADTTYSIVLGQVGPSGQILQTTQSNADNAGTSGWSIGNAYHFYSSSFMAWRPTISGRSAKIAIRGTAVSGVTNNAPVFEPASVSLSIAENTAAGEDIGAAVEATDADADTLTYTLGGTDAASFDIVESSGQIRTKSGVSYDHEAKASYTVTVTASDNTATADASVTISITDVDEPPDAPATPAVSAVSGSTTSLTVSWAAPANAGKPAIANYDVQYRAGSSGTWSDGPEDVTGTTATITSLVANTDYEARVRATNAEGDSGWSDPPGSGRTNAPTNNAPVFSSSNVARSVAENTAAGQNVGAAVTATDADAGDTLNYTLGGTDMASFDIVESSGQIRTKSGVSYDHEAKSSYTVTVTASDATATAVASVTISVTDVDEPPSAPATPMVSAVSGSTTSLTVSWAAPANAGKPAIASYDVQYRVGSSGAWSDGPEDVPTTTATVTGLVANTLYEARVRATNAEGDSGWSDPPGSGRTNAPTNNAPVFSPAIVDRSIAENTAAGQNVGAAVTATDADAGDTLAYTLGGADAASFDFVGTSGQIRTKTNVSYDFEAKSSYTVTVTASDNSNATAVADVTISVTDVDEPPSAPATPMVSAVSGSTTSLTVSWAAPANAGKPAIASYDVQYRVGSSGTWTDGPEDVPTTTATVTGLVANTLYEARVRATNAEGDSGWSDPPGSGRTNAPTNNAPVFSSSNVARSVAENTAAGQNVGAAVTATDADAGDTLNYTLGGTDMASFDIVESSGQIRTKSGVSYDHEAKSSYTVTVTASDNSNATAVADVTISVTDVDEPPSAPATPMVSAVSGSTTSLTVSWAAPANAGKPAIANYDVQYRAGSSGTWSDGPEDVRGTTATVTSLVANTLYEARVRATNAEGDSGWSDPPGSGRTNAPTNNAPVFSPAIVDRSIAENTAAGQNVGAAVTATDADAGDTLAYTLGGADAASFDFVGTSGQIRTKTNVSYDFEAKSSYTVTVTASDNSNATAVADVTISVTDVDEPPSAPATPMVSAVSGSTTSLTVSWAAPANAGKPAIASYDVQYRVGSSGTWTDGPEDVPTTTATVTGLVANTLYEARVRATNAEGDSGWSDPPGSGRTNAPTNNAPVFSSSNVARSVAENTAAGQNVGAAVTATDADAGDTLNYTLGGTDMASFDIVESSGQIRTKSGVSYDHEAKSSYTVTVTASDATATAVASVTISVTDVDEPPSAPPTPAVSAVSGSTTSLTVSWAAPANAGKPAIANYDVQYRAGSSGTWSDGPEDVTGTTTTVSGLVANTLYQARVRATNAEGDSGWSDPPGSGRTNAPSTSAPGAPGNLGTTPGDGRVTLAWAAPANTGGAAILKYQYRARRTGTAAWTPDWTDVPDGSDSGSSAADETRVTVSGLTNGTEYRFEVRAVNSIGGGTAAWKNDTPVAAQVPGRPRNLLAASGNAQVTLTWEAPLDDGGAAISRYEYRHAQGTSVPASVLWQPAGLNFRQTVTGLDNDRQYTFEVRAANSAGEGPPATIQARPTASANAPSAPRFLKAVTTDRQVMLSWFAPARDGGSSITEYQYRHASGTSVPDDTPWNSAGHRLQAGSGSLTNGQRYTFQVRAVAAVAGPAASVTATPSANPVRRLPGAVSGLTATAEAYADDRRRRQYGRVTLSWNPSAVDDNSVLERFEYRYADSDSALPARWLQGSSNTTNVTIDRLKVVTDYVFEVRAVNLEGPGPAVRRSIRTPPAPEVGMSLAASRRTAIEGEALTFEVRRANRLENPAAFVLVGVTDSAFPGIPALGGPVGGDGAGGHIVKFQPDATSATGTVRVEFDGARPSTRTLTITLQGINSPDYFGTPVRLDITVTDRDAGLRVRDARVREGPGAILAFSVTLDRRLDREVAVNYATSDGTATQGDDYTRTAGTLVFSAGETSKTVSVPVVDDAHNESSETLTLTLSNARGAVIDDGTAVGTIVNSDPMPDAWLSRFGRAASDQVVQAIGRRLDGAARESHLTVTGWRVDSLFEPSHSERAAREPLPDARGRQPEGSVLAPDGRIGAAGAMAGATRGVGAMSGAGAARPALDGAMTQGSPPMQGGTLQSPARAVGGLPAGAGANPAAAVGASDNRWLDLMGRLFMALGPNGGKALAARDMVKGSSFYYGYSPDAGPLRGMNRLTAWGEGASTRFSGAEGKLSLDGEVNTAIVGADGEWGRWLAGVALSYSEGEGDYRQNSAKGSAVSSTLTGVNPYARYRLDERTSLWGTFGYGRGRLTLTPKEAESSLETDMTNVMAAFGGRGVLSMRTGETGQFELALRSDAMLTDTTSAAVTGLAAGEGATNRIRLILEGSGSLPAFGGVLAPKVEAGLRYDGGDAETGAGLEVGGGLAYDMRRLTVKVDGRVLLTHQDRDYEEWGYSLSFVYQPAKNGRGLRLKGGSQWGVAQSGVHNLWSLQNAGGLANAAHTANEQRYTAELGYGFGVRRLWYPYIATESGGASSRSLRFGLKLNAGSDLEAGLEIGRRAHMSGRIENDIRLQLRARW